jgi:hypothetical protein
VLIKMNGLPLSVWVMENHSGMYQLVKHFSCGRNSRCHVTLLATLKHPTVHIEVVFDNLTAGAWISHFAF